MGLGAPGTARPQESPEMIDTGVQPMLSVAPPFQKSPRRLDCKSLGVGCKQWALQSEQSPEWTHTFLLLPLALGFKGAHFWGHAPCALVHLGQRQGHDPEEATTSPRDTRYTCRAGEAQGLSRSHPEDGVLSPEPCCRDPGWAGGPGRGSPRAGRV